MIPLLVLAAALVPLAPAAGADDADPVHADQELEMSRRALVLAFEKGTPPLDTVAPMLERHGDDSGDGSEGARGRQQEARSLQAVLAEVVGLQAGPRAPAAASAGPGLDPVAKKRLDTLGARVDAVSDALRIEEPARRSAVLALYVTRWQKGRAGLTPHAAAEERAYATAGQRAADAQRGAQARVNARLHGLGFDSRGDPGGAPPPGFVRASYSPSSGRAAPAPGAPAAPLTASAMRPAYHLKVAAVPDLHPRQLTDAEARDGRYSAMPTDFAMDGQVRDINEARNRFYNDPRNKDRTNPALDEAEHRVGMYQLTQGVSRYLPDSMRPQKTTTDLVVGGGAVVVYNVVLGVPLGVYQSVTGKDPGGLGMGGHFVYGLSRFTRGVVAHYQGGPGDDSDWHFAAAEVEFRSGWADFVGDLRGVAQRVRDDVGL